MTSHWVRIAADKKLPFDPLVPDAKTRGEVVTVGGIDNLLADLNADD